MATSDTKVRQDIQAVGLTATTAAVTTATVTATATTTTAMISPVENSSKINFDNNRKKSLETFEECRKIFLSYTEVRKALAKRLSEQTAKIQPPRSIEEFEKCVKDYPALNYFIQSEMTSKNWGRIEYIEERSELIDFTDLSNDTVIKDEFQIKLLILLFNAIEELNVRAVQDLIALGVNTRVIASIKLNNGIYMATPLYHVLDNAKKNRFNIHNPTELYHASYIIYDLIIAGSPLDTYSVKPEKEQRKHSERASNLGANQNALLHTLARYSAIYYELLPVLEFVLQNKPDVNIMNKQINTPLISTLQFIRLLRAQDLQAAYMVIKLLLETRTHFYYYNLKKYLVAFYQSKHPYLIRLQPAPGHTAFIFGPGGKLPIYEAISILDEIQLLIHNDIARYLTSALVTNKTWKYLNLTKVLINDFELTIPSPPGQGFIDCSREEQAIVNLIQKRIKEQYTIGYALAAPIVSELEQSIAPNKDILSIAFLILGYILNHNSYVSQGYLYRRHLGISKAFPSELRNASAEIAAIGPASATGTSASGSGGGLAISSTALNNSICPTIQALPIASSSSDVAEQLRGLFVHTPTKIEASMSGSVTVTATRAEPEYFLPKIDELIHSFERIAVKWEVVTKALEELTASPDLIRLSPVLDELKVTQTPPLETSSDASNTKTNADTKINNDHPQVGDKYIQKQFLINYCSCPSEKFRDSFVYGIITITPSLTHPETHTVIRYEKLDSASNQATVPDPDVFLVVKQDKSEDALTNKPRLDICYRPHTWKGFEFNEGTAMVCSFKNYLKNSSKKEATPSKESNSLKG